jgi:hypothetical protein
MTQNFSPTPLIDNNLEGSFQEKIIEIPELQESIQIPTESPTNETPPHKIPEDMPHKQKKNFGHVNMNKQKVMFWTEDPNILLNSQ